MELERIHDAKNMMRTRENNVLPPPMETKNTSSLMPSNILHWTVQCQRYEHSKTVCRGHPTCTRCAEVGHDSADCKAKEPCVNCKGDHSSFSQNCPTRILEKEITAVKIKNSCRVSPEDKGCRAYPLGPHPHAVGRYPRCTPGKPRAWFLPDDRHNASLVGLRGGWRHARTKLLFTHIDTNRLCLVKRVSERPDHWDENCRLVDATCCWPSGSLERAVRNCWEQWTREGTHKRETGSGATRKTTRRDDRRIVRQALVDPTVTRSTIPADVGIAIVPQTISRHLAETNLKSGKVKIFPLSPLAAPSTEAILPLVLKGFSSSWADRVESSGLEKTIFSSSTEEQQNVPDSARFFIMRTAETWSKVSSFLIEKAISGSIGAVKTIRKMRSGDVFIEMPSSQQASVLTKLRRLTTIDVTVVAHRSLNYSRGVISAADLLHVSTEEILENLQDQKVCGVKRIMIRRDGHVLDTKHLILIFASPDLPQSIKAAYLHCPVRPYIPNPL
ncbi:uncharacterized protein TNCV_4206841 [Trichonephila clavipes]|nr:uncharacterized protein TNCV_4206841 [Trichonephila clavipes]